MISHGKQNAVKCVTCGKKLRRRDNSRRRHNLARNLQQLQVTIVINIDMLSVVTFISMMIVNSTSFAVYDYEK